MCEKCREKSSFIFTKLKLSLLTQNKHPFKLPHDDFTTILSDKEDIVENRIQFS